MTISHLLLLAQREWSAHSSSEAPYSKPAAEAGINVTEMCALIAFGHKRIARRMATALKPAAPTPKHNVHEPNYRAERIQSPRG